MAVLMLAGVFFLSREGAKQVAMKNVNQKTVVIDAGHGGSDPGKIGINDVLEKDLNLVISEKLKKLLEEEGFQVVMTRTKDEGLYDPDAVNKKVQDLQRRCDLIHKTQPVCAVSIHQNSYSQEGVSGAQVFYYKDSAQGQRLAACVQEQLIAQVDPENHRQEKGNTTYYLLKKTDVPLVIVECGFLSNRNEAQLLTEEAYQEKIAAAVRDGVLQYMEETEK